MIVESAYRPASWLPNAHLMTLWPVYMRPYPRLRVRAERWEREDGDFNDLAWVGDEAPADAPIVIVFHGLQGSIDASKYVRGVLAQTAARGWRGVLMHFRGCSGEPNRLPRAYHSGETEDPRAFVAEVRRRFPEAPLFAVGFSLGANVLLKLLGEDEDATPLTAASAVCAPMLLGPCSARMKKGVSRMYGEYLLRDLKVSLRKKRERMPILPGVDPRRIRTLWDFDEYVTAPLHGFTGAEDYYARCSCRPFLRSIRRPTYILHAADDPLMTRAVIPTEGELSDQVRLEVSPTGGHVAFVAGPSPRSASYYAEDQTLAWFEGFVTR